MAKAAPSAPNHRWSFYRAGGVDQVRLDTGADILNLDQLDQKLWVALSCPVKGLEIDTRTLELLDEDNDGFVRPVEILKTIRWLRNTLKNADGLAKGEDGVQLTNLRSDTPEGKLLLGSAMKLLKDLGKPEAKLVTVDDAMHVGDALAKAALNGDGIVVADALADANARAVAADIIACTGGLPDRSGGVGFDRAGLEAFYQAAADFDAWQRVAEANPKQILPLGADTAAAWAALEAVRGKINDYFGRCRLAAFDARALAALNREEAAYITAAAKDLDISASEMAGFPLAQIEPGKPLPLQQGTNPAWTAKLADFQRLCAGGKPTLNEADWAALQAKLAPYGDWLAQAKGQLVAGLGLPRVRAILAGKERAALADAIANDLAVADEVAAMTSLEKLARLHRDFSLLLHNFVNFSDFYARKGAIFQAGTLFLDRRELDLCFHVADAGKHATLAPMSRAYLAYVDCTRPGAAKMQIACAFTAGDADHLFVGRNGIFYDRKGNDWNATITKIVDNPISVRQAFWSPYKKLMRWIEEQVNKRAAEADAASTAKLQEAAATTGEAAAKGSAPAGAAAPKKMDIGVLAAISVAISGVTAVVGKLLEEFFGLGYLMPLGLLGVLLLISGPAMLIAWMKLRQRNLGPILDANGWAVNTLTKINIPLGGALTELPHLPAGSHRTLKDPYAEKKSPWPRIVFLVLLLAGAVYGLYYNNLLHRWLPDYVPAHHVFADRSVASAGEVVTFTVPSNAVRLNVTATDAATPAGTPLAPVLVHPKTRKATLTIPAEMASGLLVVEDPESGHKVTILVTAAEPK